MSLPAPLNKVLNTAVRSLRRLVVVCCLASAVVVGPVWAQDFWAGTYRYDSGDWAHEVWAGTYLYDSGDIAGALRVLRPLANRGNAEAQVVLCLHEQEEENYAKAMEWCHKAAQQGHCDAMLELCLMYDGEEGVPHDEAKADEWFEKFMSCED